MANEWLRMFLGVRTQMSSCSNTHIAFAERHVLILEQLVFASLHLPLLSQSPDLQLLTYALIFSTPRCVEPSNGLHPFNEEHINHITRSDPTEAETICVT